MADYHHMANVEDWVTCPECGSDDVEVTKPNYYESKSDCQNCVAEVWETW